VQKAVASPDGLIPVAILVVGHPAETPPPTPRRPVDELVISII
jgi:nitroreductase